MELSQDEQLALLYVIKKRVNEAYNKLELEKKYRLLDLQKQAPDIDRLGILANGTKVGEVSLPHRKGKVSMKPGREDEALAYLSACGLTTETPIQGWEAQFINTVKGVICTITGEECGDLFYYQPPIALAPRITGCKEEAVKNAFTGMLDFDELDPLHLLGGN